MRRLVQLVLCSLAVANLALAVCAPALAKGPKSSAASGTTSSASTSSTTGTLSPSPPAAATNTVTTATAAASTTASQPRSRDLPYTGLNLVACVLIGMGLLGGGLLLRRLVT